MARQAGRQASGWPPPGLASFVVPLLKGLRVRARSFRCFVVLFSEGRPELPTFAWPLAPTSGPLPAPPGPHRAVAPPASLSFSMNKGPAKAPLPGLPIAPLPFRGCRAVLLRWPDSRYKAIVQVLYADPDLPPTKVAPPG